VPQEVLEFMLAGAEEPQADSLPGEESQFDAAPLEQAI
jgi:hypothetical protein